MRFFEVGLGTVPKITLIGKEFIEPHETHVSRYATEYILYAVTQGYLSLFESNRELVLKKGDVCIFKKGDYQRPHGISDCEYYFVHFETDSFFEKEYSVRQYEDALKEKRERNLTRTLRGGDCVEGLYAILKQEYSVSDAGFFDYVVKTIEKCRLSCLHFDPERYLASCMELGKLLLRLEGYGLSQISGMRSDYGKKYALTEKIVRYIEERYNESFNSWDIEEKFEISFDYANRVFKKIMDCTIMKYHNNIRIEHAMESLRVTNKSIAEIGEEIGISDAYYFGRLFKKVAGISPGQYRDNYKKEKIQKA